MDAESDRPDKSHQSEELSAQRGRLSFGYFALADQRKVTRPAGRNQNYQSDAFKQTQKIPTYFLALGARIENNPRNPD